MTTTPYEAMNLRETAEALGSLLRHLDRLVLYASEDEIDNLEEAAQLLLALSNAKASLRDAYSEYETLLAKAMEDTYQIDLPGGVTAERMEGAPRKSWEHKRLAKEVATRIVESSMDFDTGEVLMTREEMVEELLRYAAPSYWRVKQLKQLGIDADNYCQLGDPKVSVVIKQQKG